MPEPVVSVIICTRNRPDRLLCCVASIAEASARCQDLPIEILVIESMSSPCLALDETAVLLAANKLGKLVRLGHAGLSSARNAGLREARGRLLVFTDDDCIMDGQFLVDLMRRIGSRRGPHFIGGRVTLSDQADLPFTIKDDPVDRIYTVSSHPGGFLQGCNFVLSRETVALLGEFDTRFGVGAMFRAGEDTDYIIRGHLAGVPIKYVSDMQVAHRHGRKLRSEVETLNHSYAYANGALYAKYITEPWLLKHLYWGMRSAAREAFGGPAFNREIGITWKSTMRANLAGMYAYLRKDRDALPLASRVAAPPEILE